jgi:hypothetical protein
MMLKVSSRFPCQSKKMLPGAAKWGSPQMPVPGYVSAGEKGGVLELRNIEKIVSERMGDKQQERFDLEKPSTNWRGRHSSFYYSMMERRTMTLCLTNRKTTSCSTPKHFSLMYPKEIPLTGYWVAIVPDSCHGASI